MEDDIMSNKVEATWHPNAGPDPVYCRGGTHRFMVLDTVAWQGEIGRVIALTIEPSVTVEFESGRRLTVGQSTLVPARGHAVTET